MTVYFIKPIGMDGPIKIGCSATPDKRRNTLSTWSPFELEIVAQIAGDKFMERRFHAAFEKSHQRREWFTPTPELLATIEAINAGTFDVATLPEPIFVANRHVSSKAWTPERREQQSLSLRVNHVHRTTGYWCKDHRSNLIALGDKERIAAVHAYLADPAKHGKPTMQPWAIKLHGISA